MDNGVLVSNIIACAIMGYLLAIPINNPMAKVGIISLCGGLSTFSGYIAFSYLYPVLKLLLYHVMSIGLGLLFLLVATTAVNRFSLRLICIFARLPGC